ncbi:MAG: glycosyl hydrolase [Acidobacteria bacterium]|nr:glycosyl hydrolase [Acidobacteriota bacterium]
MKPAAALAVCLCAVLCAQDADTRQRADSDATPATTFNGLRFRTIGPAFTSGRVNQFAVHPDNSNYYYVAVASGGVWKTVNNGVTWTPLFDSQGSYSIGTITLDPKNPSVVWVGTGENNNQRSVSYGDGVYKSEDAGRTWKNMGLRKSEHIAKILVDPRDSNVVYVAAPGPLWKGGGDRGLYKSTDGGKSWTSLIKVGEYTGVADVIMDPRNPDILLASTHQRQRRYFTLVHGGPESAVWRSTDAGKTWTKAGGGLPTGELGRIGLAYAPSNPSILYAQVEGPESKGGLYRSADNGVTWEKRNSFDQQGQYYSKVVVDPHSAGRVYIMNVNIQVSDDGGRTLASLPTRDKHVDNHDIWVDPKQPDHYRVACDGGVYESYDRAANWEFKANLPIAQLYDIGLDDATPFYNVYGGTQDNGSFGCASRTKTTAGVTNSDCFVTNGGDGFYTKADPKDLNTVYASSQHAGIVRFDRRTGERVSIQPQPAKGDAPMRWNWDAPYFISPHSNTRLYIGSQRLFRSDDRGDSWRAVSPDLTRQLDRNKLLVMGKVQGADAIQKNVSTALYGNISALAESPKQEGLIYVGTDDGLVQITEDGGKTWRKAEKMAGAPEDGYIQRIVASQHDAGTVYVVVDNHQNGDFKPYVAKSADRGRSWTSAAGNLPEPGSVYALAEDPIDPKLLFAGTEFSAFFSNDGGEKWTKLNAGLPVIQVRDIAIQKRENDLVLGTFGRGIYILDDYSALRNVAGDSLKREFTLFPVRGALSYIPASPLGGLGKASLGEQLYAAPNPPLGATFTYFLKDQIRTKKQQREQREREAARKNETAPYPTPDELRAEAQEEAPAVILSIADAAGKIVRRIEGPMQRGIQRVTWDLRGPAPTLPPPGARRNANADPDDEDSSFRRPTGPLALPGKYTVTAAKRVNGALTPLPGSQSFEVAAEGPSTKEDRQALAEFQEKTARLQKSMATANLAAADARTRISAIIRAIDATPTLAPKAREEAKAIESRLRAIQMALQGDDVMRQRNEATPVSIQERVGAAAGAVRGTTGRPTKTAQEAYQIANEELTQQLAQLRRLMDTDLKNLEKELDRAGAPPTPGRF